jgi:formate-dependent nitrite reductase membrane component NrfD
MQETRLPAPVESAITVIRGSLTSPELIEQLATLATGYTPNPEKELEEPTYYDYPAMNEPTWHWEIIWYFFFGGLAAGCYLIATVASLFGSKEDRATVRAGYYLSLLALLPCPVLLIKDLGRPERFLHMLRVFKVKSPMSMGTWALTTFSLFSGLMAVIQAAHDGLLGNWWGPDFLKALPRKVIAFPGIFFGLFLGSYTGVLLAATSVPIWSRSKLLGALFASSATSTSTALISLVLRIFGAPAAALHKLERLEWIATLVEMTELFSFLRGSSRAGRALAGAGQGEQGPAFWNLVVGSGLLIPWLLTTLSLLQGGKKHTGRGLLTSLLVLTGGYFLRRTIVKAGHTSSRDPHVYLWNAKRENR